MSWTALNASESDMLYCWFPGWGFSAEVFSPLYQQLSGSHLGADYVAGTNLEPHALNLSDQLNQICHQQPIKKIICIGWSLGGALAIHTLKQFQMVSDIPTALITLATGERFVQQPEISTQGMQQEAFAAFSENLEKFPAKTAKRFLGLCTQHADAPRALMRELSNTQLCEATRLIESLNWLNYARLPAIEIPQQHWYAQQDSFNPRRLIPAFESSQSSHAFFLAEPGQKELFKAIQSLQYQLNSGGVC